MGNVSTNNRAGGAFGEADGCIDTPAGISHHASRYVLSIPNNSRDRDILPPAPIEGQRYRSVLAEQLEKAEYSHSRRLTALLSYGHAEQCELRYSTYYLQHARYMPSCEAEPRSVQSQDLILGSGLWTRFSTPFTRLTLQKWIQRIWLLTSRSGLLFLQWLYEQRGSGHYA